MYWPGYWHEVSTTRGSGWLIDMGVMITEAISHPLLRGGTDFLTLAAWKNESVFQSTQNVMSYLAVNN